MVLSCPPDLIAPSFLSFSVFSLVFSLIRDASRLACVCTSSAAARTASIWRSRVRVTPRGVILAPASGTFDVTVAPGQSVQEAVDRCPPDGCVLLLPGNHSGPLVLGGDKDVHVFGRGRATLASAGAGVCLTSMAARSTIDGVILKQGIAIHDGGLRLQACNIFGGKTYGVAYSAARIEHTAHPTLLACHLLGGNRGVFITGNEANCRLEGCLITHSSHVGINAVNGANLEALGCAVNHIGDGDGIGLEARDNHTVVRVRDCTIANNLHGIWVESAHAVLNACVIRDNQSYGVYMSQASIAQSSIAADCYIVRNSMGGVFHDGQGVVLTDSLQ